MVLGFFSQIHIAAYIAVVLHAVSIALGTIILVASWHTLRPTQGIHLMWWHVLAVNVGMWGFHTLFAARIVSDAGDFDSVTYFIGEVPLWFVVAGLVFLLINDIGLWLILKVQRGRYQLQKCNGRK